MTEETQHASAAAKSLQLCLTLCDPMDCSTQLSCPSISRSLLKLMSTESVMPSNHLILCCPLRLLPSIFCSIRVFYGESALHIRWTKYWSFSFSISPSSEWSKINQFDLLAVQGTLKSLLQHHSLKASILWHSAFFILCLSHLYITTGKTLALTIYTFVGKVMSLFLNLLSTFVIAFLPKEQLLLILWLSRNKICHCFHCFPICLA